MPCSTVLDIGDRSCNDGEQGCFGNKANIANDACNGFWACNVNKGNVSIGAW